MKSNKHMFKMLSMEFELYEKMQPEIEAIHASNWNLWPTKLNKNHGISNYSHTKQTLALYNV